MRPPLILLLEDNADEAELMRHALASAGVDCRLEVHTEGQAFLNALAAGNPDTLPALLLLDLKLLGMDGLEVLRQVRAAPRTRSIPALILTSSELLTDVRRAYELGANAFLRKPVLLQDFIALLRNLAQFWFSPSLIRLEYR
jgi:two-component system response regulator